MTDYKWFGHAAFMLQGGGKTIYIDPYQLEGAPPKADIILATHSHHDHFSLEDINKIAKADTVLIATGDCVGWEGEMIAIQPGQRAEVGSVQVEAVPAYNIGKQFHPKERSWVGYVITLEGTRFYHAGDTDLIPEMKGIEADVAFLPVGGKYTMNAAEAAQAANTIRPKTAIPMHWGAIIGSDNDAEAFRNQTQVPVEILAQERG